MLLLVAMGLGIGETKAEDNVKYVDVDGVEKTQNDVTVLTGNETVLGSDGAETWYVTSGTTNFVSTITLKGHVHIILANGTTMNVGTSESRVSGSGITSNNLSVHGQKQGDGTVLGTLNVFANGDAGIGVKDLTICGGCITSSNSGGNAINSTGNLVIYGGQVTSTSTEGGDGIYAYKFILGWSDRENDFIQSSSYSVPDKQMRTADGKSFADLPPPRQRCPQMDVISY